MRDTIRLVLSVWLWLAGMWLGLQAVTAMFG